MAAPPQFLKKGARLTAQVGAACGVRVQRVLRVLRFDGGFAAEGCGIAAFGGDEYKVSVTGLPLVSPVLHDEEPEPPSTGRRCRR